MRRFLTVIVVLTFSLSSCTTNPITGRKQLTLVSEQTLQQEAVNQYRSFLSENKVVSASTNKDAEMVKRVGTRIARAITDYYSSKGLANVLEGYNWEFNLVQSPEVNAWCMPGGKVVVYTGLLGVTKNEAALAVVLGHEITHAVAGHGQERISQAMAAQGLELAGNIFTSGNQKANQIFNAVYAPSAQIGVLLPNSRKQEYEADHYGLLFSAMAGYNPNEAIPFWERMAALKQGKEGLEILSTHPLDEKRIQALKGYIAEALQYYKPIKQ
ncbi:MAG: M48 family metallopeptidase [Chitinophagaceae bacterium]|nr:M48 family metallopeptidase [Chitinophagaceae bacterium]MCW5913474.1 M48 family metallopeptidase [Chitinophagaceae bacterium]MCZ2395772.1 M48 family metallopeptidase [Chitinophagales bacterium]